MKKNNSTHFAFARLRVITAWTLISASVLLAAISFATLVPSAGTLTDSSGPITFTGGPYLVANPSSQATGVPTSMLGMAITCFFSV